MWTTHTPCWVGTRGVGSQDQRVMTRVSVGFSGQCLRAGVSNQPAQLYCGSPFSWFQLPLPPTPLPLLSQALTGVWGGGDVIQPSIGERPASNASRASSTAKSTRSTYRVLARTSEVDESLFGNTKPKGGPAKLAQVG